MSPMSTSRSRGTTIPELLIFAALFLVVLGAVYSSLVMGLKAYRRTEAFASLQQQAMQALHQVSDELASSPAFAVRLDTNAVVFLSARTPSGVLAYDANGKVMWQAWVMYSVEDQGGRSVLVRRELAITPTPTPPTSVPTVNTMRSSAAALRTAARDITTLECTPGTSVGIRLVASTSDSGSSSVQFLDRVSFRPNGG